MAKTFKIFLLFLLTLTLSVGKSTRLPAQSNNAPTELLEMVTKIDLAANNQDLSSLQEYISPEFTNEDGLDYESFSNSVEQLWSKYEDLQYSTEIESWREEEGQLVGVTVTTIKGSYEINGQKYLLNSQIKAEQYFIDNKLVKQNILGEKNEITSGDKPPVVQINIPEQARAGQQFNFDVILEEPVGSDLVLGAAIEEKIDSSLFAEPSSLELETLSAGGIFKRVTLPSTPNDHWYSIILIRSGGMRMITQRVNVD